jgi:hypothetical protein
VSEPSVKRPLGVCERPVRSVMRILPPRDLCPARGRGGAEPGDLGRRPWKPCRAWKRSGQEPPGVWGSERSHGGCGNWGSPPRPRLLRCSAGKRWARISGDPAKSRAGREGGGGVRSTDRARRTTQPRVREGALLHPRFDEKGRTGACPLGPTTPGRTRSENSKSSCTWRPSGLRADGFTRSGIASIAGMCWSGRGSRCVPIAVLPGLTASRSLRSKSRASMCSLMGSSRGFARSAIARWRCDGCISPSPAVRRRGRLASRPSRTGLCRRRASSSSNRSSRLTSVAARSGFARSDQRTTRWRSSVAK